ncbi:MAG: AraC family transcriptional regulator [Pseudomonadota bacterium]
MAHGHECVDGGQFQFDPATHTTIGTHDLNSSFSDPATPELSVHVVESASPSVTPTTFDLGCGRFVKQRRAGDVMVYPVGQPTQADGPGPMRLLSWAMPWHMIRDRLELVFQHEVTNLCETLYTKPHSSICIVDILSQLREALDYSHPADRLRIDGLNDLLLRELLCLGNTPLAMPSQRDRLHRRQVSAAMEYARAHLSLRIGLDDLAAAAGCSRYHFVRLFRTSTGKTPLQWVTEQRI